MTPTASYQDMIEEARRITAPYSGQRTAFWLNVDFIEFRIINHCCGKEAGDRLLHTFLDDFSSLPEIRFCRRIISDQFLMAAVFETPQSDEEIRAWWAQRSEDFLARQQKVYPECYLRLCCGVCPAGEESADEHMDNVTIAHKEAHKNASRAAVVYSPLLLEQMKTRQKQELEIVTALREGQFIYYLQPIVDLYTGKIICAEALARWRLPDGTIRCPDFFLPIMEETGDAVELDFQILRQVCRDMADRRDRGLPVVRIAVNLSRYHIKDADTASKLHSIVQEYGFPPKAVDFELTETIPLAEMDSAKQLIDSLHERDYKVSIDDYGDGYTSVAIWQDLDFDILKMDRRFLSDGDTVLRDRNAILLPSTVDLATQMSVCVVGEGVERKEQYERLLRSGCHIAQGFYFSCPVPPEDFYRAYRATNGVYPVDSAEADESDFWEA